MASSSSSSAAGSGNRFGEIFGKPLPENPTLIESLSVPWRPKKPTDHCSFTEIFGELHFREPTYDSSSSSSVSPPPPTSKAVVNPQPEIEKLDGDDDKNNENEMKPSSDSLFGGIQENQYMKSSKSTGTTGFSLKKAESLKLCTEGLGFESSGDVDNSKDEGEDDWNNIRKGKMSITKNSSGNLYGSRRLKQIQGSYPPPITSLGKNGKPWVCLKSFRYNGRFVLKEIEIPNKEVLHACREDGRLTLHLVEKDDEISDADEYDDAYEQEDEKPEYDGAYEQEDEKAEYDGAYEQEDKGGEGNKSESGNVKVEGNQ